MPKFDINVRFPVLRSPAELSALAAALGPDGRRQILRQIGREFVLMTRETFGAGGKNRPLPWAPLSKKYQKRIKYFGPPKLTLRGDLINSIRQVADSSDSTVIHVGQGKSLDYATAHQYGWHSLPARPFMPIHPDRTLTEQGRLRLEFAGHRALVRAIIERL